MEYEVTLEELSRKKAEKEEVRNNYLIIKPLNAMKWLMCLCFLFYITFSFFSFSSCHKIKVDLSKITLWFHTNRTFGFQTSQSCSSIIIRVEAAKLWPLNTVLLTLVVGSYKPLNNVRNAHCHHYHHLRPHNHHHHHHHHHHHVSKLTQF